MGGGSCYCCGSGGIGYVNIVRISTQTSRIPIRKVHWNGTVTCKDPPSSDIQIDVALNVLDDFAVIKKWPLPTSYSTS